jgi:hypothetical protein
VICLLIPVTNEDFDYFVDNEIENTFINSVIYGDKNRFKQQIEMPYNKFKFITEKHSIVVHKRMTFNKFKEVIKGSNFSVIVIIGHAPSDLEVEFWDRKVRAEEIADAIPQDFTSIIDLNVCKPLKLYELLARKQNSLTFRRNALVSLMPMFYFYSALFELIDKKELTYINAFETIMNNFK